MIVVLIIVCQIIVFTILWKRINYIEDSIDFINKVLDVYWSETIKLSLLKNKEDDDNND